ncbi:MAG: hypothetical protein IT304_05150 [Dehalococcoidia bacterium]|nr:hypothetical protein [Dehalococcoidia bacterium]
MRIPALRLLPRSLTLLAAAAVLAALGLGAALGAGRSEARQAPTPSDAVPPDAQVGTAPTLVFQCFPLDAGDDPKMVVGLTTKNWGLDIVGVRKSDRMCESANKYRVVDPTTQPLPPDPTLVMQCYVIQKGIDPDDPVALITKNFGTHTATVRRATRMCEGASKQRLDKNEPPPPAVSGPVWQCFDLQQATPMPPGLFFLVTRNFGPERVLVLKPVLMCEEAMKQTAAGNVLGHASGLVYECFQAESNTNHAVPAILDTANFAPDAVRIRRANMMCEPAQKIRLFDIPGLNLVAPAASPD